MENCNTNKSKTLNLCIDFSITKQNVMPGHEITEASIYILYTDTLGNKAWNIKIFLAICCGNKEIQAVTTTDCHSM
jgi:hypothetical protein